MTQKETLLNYLKEGKGICRYSAFNLFGIKGFSKIIQLIKADGYTLRTKRVYSSSSCFTRYFLNQ